MEFCNIALCTFAVKTKHIDLCIALYDAIVVMTIFSKIPESEFIKCCNMFM
jgi:hypothetical protein